MAETRTMSERYALTLPDVCEVKSTNKGFIFEELAAECVSAYCGDSPIDEKARTLVERLRRSIPNDALTEGPS